MTVANELEFVRRASKAIIWRLLPDDLPVFDVMWRAMVPILEELAEADYTPTWETVVGHIRGEGFAARGSDDVHSLEASSITVLQRSLTEARRQGPCSEDEIGQIVAKEGLHFPSLPGHFLKTVQAFVVDFFGGVSMHPASEATPCLPGISPLKYDVCYYVFHGGGHHFYPRELPPDVLRLQDGALFWINRAAGDLRSCGQLRPRGKWPRPQAESVLRFLCDEHNAGREIPLVDLYRHVWQKAVPAGAEKKVLNSVRVAVAALNGFAAKSFEGPEPGALVRYISECCSYRPRDDAPKECCIVRPVSLPE